MNDALHRKNVRVAWFLAGFALLVLVSSVPFWKGLFQLMTAAGGG